MQNETDNKQPARLVLQGPSADREGGSLAMNGGGEGYWKLAESIADPFFALDREFRFTCWNRASETGTGLPVSAVMGKHFFEVFPELRGTNLEAVYREVLATGEAGFVENRWDRPGGEATYHDVSVYPIRGGIAVFSRDITGRKLAETALRESEERYYALSQELREIDLRKNEFLSVLSHELRNPLTPIHASLRLLEHTGLNADQTKRALAVIARQVDQLSRIVDDILDVTRVRQNKIRLQKRRVELNEQVRRTVEDHRAHFDKCGVSLEARYAPSPVYVQADSIRLAQILGNLLQNAAKFTGKGGQARVSVACNRNRRLAIVRVVDTGIGIPPQALPRLFEPFMQADTALHRSRSGLGLGLTLAKGLIELHGGEIRVYSAGPGKGAEFIVFFPLDESAGEERPAVAPAPPHRCRRVLIIEDQADLCQSLHDLLELNGHEVAVADGGPEGLAAARKFRPEVVLCDIGLPGMDGYAVAEAFRADETLRGVLMVAMTGYAGPEDLRRAVEAGFDQYLTKPPDLSALERILAGVS